MPSDLQCPAMPTHFAAPVGVRVDAAGCPNDHGGALCLGQPARSVPHEDLTPHYVTAGESLKLLVDVLVLDRRDGVVDLPRASQRKDLGEVVVVAPERS